MKKIYFFLFLLITIVYSSNAQSWMNTISVKDNRKANFFDIQKAFNDYAQGKDPKNIKGYKQYKRWEWFYSKRVDENGNMPSSKEIWKHYRRQVINHKQFESNPSNWIAFAPDSIPPSPDSTSIIGMGRINSITFHPTDTNTLWVGSSQGGLWKTTDNGVSWVCLTDDLPLLRVSDMAVDPNNTNVIYLATGDINYVGFNTIAAGRYYQFGMGVLKSIDGGQTWDTTGLSFNLTDGESSLIRKIVVNPANSNEIIAAGVDGIYKTTNAGVNWTKVSSEMICDLDVNPLDSDVQYASGFYNPNDTSSHALIMKTVDFGDSWTILNTGIPQQGGVYRVETAVALSDTNYVYAITCGTDQGLYAIYKSIDAGTTWEVVAAHDTTLVANSHNQIPNLLGWADGGLSGFMPDEGGQGTYDLTLLVDPNDENRVFSGGVNMWGSPDGGVTWDITSMWVKMFGASLHADQHFSTYNPITKKIYQTNDGGIEYTDNLQIGDYDYIYNNCINWAAILAGDYDNAILSNCYELPTNWVNISHGLDITEYYRLGGCRSNSQLIVAGAQDNGTYLYNNNTWMSTWGGDGMEAMIDHYNDQIIYATNYNGALNKSTDGGYTYTQSITAYITDTAGESGDWVTPFVMHPQNSNVIYGGFRNVWKSTDGGMNWVKISPWNSTAGALKALAVAQSNPDSVIYCSRGNVLYRTFDGGSTWNSIVNPNFPTYQITYIAVDGEDAQNIWVTFAGYNAAKKVFHSTDGGSNWINISDGLPNVAMNCIVHQYGTINGVHNAVYVGTDVGVYYTNDSIQNTVDKWIFYSNGLPNVVVSELEIQYDIQKIRAATYGRGIWESDMFSLTTQQQTVDDGKIFQLQIYPNPIKENVHISINADLHNINKISGYVFNLKGDKISSFTDSFTDTYHKVISLKSFAAGTYIVQINVNGNLYSRKIVKE